MSKKTILLLILILPFLRLAAQISEIEQIFRSPDYVQYTSIVRNYNETYNVLTQYGYFTNAPRADTIKGYTSFMIQNTTTGDIKHIFDLPKGYKVNDVRFVTLRKNGTFEPVDFCCFCGTRTELGNQGYLTHGFAGFFSMDEALSPSSSYTVKVRDVEKTKELYRMVCYAEEYSLYYHIQNTFLDNAVLDIIGLDDLVNAPSCFCRAKFYPDCLGSVRWDNNIRTNTNEVLTDITITDDYVVTVSNDITGIEQWIRYSGQEDHLIMGGLELNDSVNAILFTTSIIEPECDSYNEIEKFFRYDPAKICFTTGNGIEVSYHIKFEKNEGLFNSQYDYPNGRLKFLRGAYLESTPLVKELIHLPSNNATAVLFEEHNSDIVSILTWNKNRYCRYPVKQYLDDGILFQSITLQKRNGYEHLFWSGMEKNNIFSPLYLMSQRGENGGGYEQSCHKENDVEAQPITVEHQLIENQLRIIHRFPYDEVTYPVTYIPLIDNEIEKEFPCVKE